MAFLGSQSGFTTGFGTAALPGDINFSGGDVLAVAIGVTANSGNVVASITFDGPTGAGGTLVGGGFAQTAYSDGLSFAAAYNDEIGNSAVVYVSMFAAMVPPDATTITITDQGSGLEPDLAGVMYFSGANTAEFFQQPGTYPGGDDWSGVPVPTLGGDTIPYSGTWVSVHTGFSLATTVADDGFSFPATSATGTYQSAAFPNGLGPPYPGNPDVTPAYYQVGGDTDMVVPMAEVVGTGTSSPSDPSWDFTATEVNEFTVSMTWFSGKLMWLAVYTDPDIDDPFPEPPGAVGEEPFEFTHRWATLGPLLIVSPGEAINLLERHDQELEQHFAEHGCGDFEYTFRWPTFYSEFVAGTDRAVDIMERRDQELEDASAHQGEGLGDPPPGYEYVNDGSCAIALTHRWREILPLVGVADARAWELLEMRDQEIEAARSACACLTDEDGGEG